MKEKDNRLDRQQKNDVHLSTFKEREQKFYPFLDEDVPNMLEQLLQTKVIKLPECKWPEEMEKVDNLNYCKSW